MKIFAVFFILFIFSNPVLQAQSLTPQGRLKKLSRQIRGIDPTLEEYDALQVALDQHTSKVFFRKAAQVYLSSPEHVGRMVNRLDELFRLKTQSQPAELAFNDKTIPPGYSSPYVGDLGNSLDYLFKDIVENNLSWDQLLTGKKYTVFFNNSNLYGRGGDEFFFRGIFSSLQDILKKDPYFDKKFHRDLKPVKVEGSEDDPRLAGALTTARFLKRYTTSDFNLNRRRAAAVFRIFLCEPLQPVVQQNLDDINKLLDQTFDKSTSVHGAIENENKRHGTDPHCISCHERLDPLGQTFSTSAQILLDQPVPGSLFFRRYSGPPVDIPGRGIGDLGKAITTTPEYDHCQVKQFWNWFIGTDVAMGDKEDRLVSVFDQLGHKPNSFIAYLVNLPEFYSPPKNSVITFGQVKDTFARCASCHMAEGDAMAEPPTDLTQLPFGGDLKTNTYWISKVAKVLGFVPGVKAVMPPKDSDWQPSEVELRNIKNWMASGAADQHGKATLSTEDLNSVKESMK